MEPPSPGAPMYKSIHSHQYATLQTLLRETRRAAGLTQAELAQRLEWNQADISKVESGVRLRYNWKNPNTGEVEEILIECTETRDQPKNKERALARLRTFIYDKEHQKYVDDIANRRKTLVSTGDRSAKIRTYNYPQGRITDHRINYTIYNLQAFMDGDIQDCIDHLIVAENAERLKEAEM